MSVSPKTFKSNLSQLVSQELLLDKMLQKLPTKLEIEVSGKIVKYFQYTPGYYSLAGNPDSESIGIITNNEDLYSQSENELFGFPKTTDQLSLIKDGYVAFDWGQYPYFYEGYELYKEMTLNAIYIQQMV